MPQILLASNVGGLSFTTDPRYGYIPVPYKEPIIVPCFKDDNLLRFAPFGSTPSSNGDGDVVIQHQWAHSNLVYNDKPSGVKVYDTFDVDLPMERSGSSLSVDLHEDYTVLCYFTIDRYMELRMTINIVDTGIMYNRWCSRYKQLRYSFGFKADLWEDPAIKPYVDKWFSHFYTIDAFPKTRYWIADIPSISAGILVHYSITPGVIMPDPNEPTTFLEYKSLGFSFPTYGLNDYGFSRAAYNAVEELPVLRQNVIQNLIEIVSSFRSLRAGLQTADSLAKGAADAWLAYRYAYKTTVSDLYEIERLLERLYALPKTISSTGRFEYHGTVYKCTVTCQLPPITNIGKRLNVRLSLENVWDMIPYSFIVDWIAPIGDRLHDLQLWLDEPQYVTSVWYSATYHYGNENVGGRTYLRFAGKLPILPAFDVKYGPSRATLFRRAADLVALII